MKDVTWITTADIRKAVVKSLRTLYPTGYRIYGKPDTEGYEVPAFFIDVRLTDREQETINVISKEYRVYIVYFQADPDAETAEADNLAKVDEIADALCTFDKRNRKHTTVMEVNGRYLPIADFGSDYTGQANNILSISFTLAFYDFREVEETEPIMDELELEEIIQEEE